MTWKTWALLFFALAAGAVASYAVKLAFFEEKPTNVVDESATNGPKERLLVANGFIPAGAELTAENVRLTLTPEKDVPRDGIFSFSEFAGRKTTRDYKDGEPISLYDIEAIEEDQDEDLAFVPPGCSVVPIEINSAMKTNGSRNYLKTTKLEKIVKPGDRVDFVVVKEDSASAAAGTTGPQRRRLTSTTIVEDAEVFAVADTSRLGAEGATRTSVLSALLTSEQLEQVRKASEEGKIKIVLENQDESPIEFTGSGVDVDLQPSDGAGVFTLPPQNLQASGRNAQPSLNSSDNLLSGQISDSAAANVSVNSGFVMPDFANSDSSESTASDAADSESEIADGSDANVRLQAVSGVKDAVDDSASSPKTTRDFELSSDESVDDGNELSLPVAEDAADDDVAATNEPLQETISDDCQTDVPVLSDDPDLEAADEPVSNFSDEQESSGNDVFRKRPGAAVNAEVARRDSEDPVENPAASEPAASSDETDASAHSQETKPYRGTVKLRSPFVTRTSTTPRKSRQ